MPTLQVDANGTTLYYEDSGAPAESLYYRTIILIHGSIFHGGIFRRLLPYAAQHSLRLVLLNMRDYPGSSPYTQEELSAISSSDSELQTGAIYVQGEQIAAFIEAFIRSHDIPRLNEPKENISGGIVVLTWSIANFVSMSMLGNAAMLPEKTKYLLEEYLYSVVLYDPTITSLGIPPPDNVYHPLRDQALTAKARGERFLIWVSSYFSPVSDLSIVTPSFLAERPIEPFPVPTISTMSTTELKECTDFGALERSNLSLRFAMPEVYHKNFKRALFDTQGVWPNVKAVVIWGEMSVPDCVWSAKVVRDMLAAQPEEGSTEVRREIHIQNLEGANHFAHWDRPEKVIQLLLDCL